MGWFRATQRKWIVSPLGVLPVIRALLDIHQFDPYLAEHYFRQFHPIYQRMNDADFTQLALRQTALADSVIPESNSSVVVEYLKIERKLYFFVFLNFKNWLSSVENVTTSSLKETFVALFKTDKI